MDVSADIQNAMTLARTAPVKAPHAGKTLDATKKAAKEFESVFVAQFLGSMFEGISTDGMFGGGQGEQMFRSLMLEQYGKKISDQGGFGLADSITRTLQTHQDAQQRARVEAAAKAEGKTDTATTTPIATQKQNPVFDAHPAAATGMALTAKVAPVYAAHPATIFAASVAASATKASGATP